MKDLDSGHLGAAPFETVWETRADGSHVYQSPGWYRYVGEAEGSATGEDWLRFFHPEDRPRLLREWRLSVETSGVHPYDVTVRIRRHDGEYRWFRVRGTPVFTDDGAVLKWVGTCTDVHDQDAAIHAAMLAGVPNAPAPTSRRGWRQVHFGALERRLFLLTLVGLLPIALLASAILTVNARDQKRAILASAAGTMRAVMTAVDGELATIAASLQALSASPRLAADDLAGFHAEAGAASKLRPGLINVVLTTPTGQQLVNPHVPFGTPLPVGGDVESIEEAARTQRPVVGAIIRGPVLKAPVFPVRLPVVRDGRTVYVLNGVGTPQTLLHVIQQQQMPKHGVVAVFDRHHRVVARSLNQEQWVGRPASPGLRELLQSEAQSGWGETRTLEGTAVYSVFHKSPVSGWSVAVGIPASAVDAPVLRSYAALIAATAVSIGLGLLAAFLLARRITHPMRELERAAVDVAAGRTPAVPRTDLPAVRAAGMALHAAYVEREKLLQVERQGRRVAEEANRAKDEFLAMLGHELRNPLNAITTAAALLQRSQSADTAQQAKDIIARQSLHLGRLTDDLLDAGRVMLGKIVLARAPVDLAALVDHELKTLARTGRLLGYGVDARLEPAWVWGDRTRLEQVIGNLLGNALKYTPRGGTIGVAVGRERDDAVLRVRDTGIGLEPDLLPRVFDLFVQGARSADRAQGGLGIGLTLVRRLAELHGGAVEAHSDGANRGAEFVVRLPAVAAPPAEPANAPAGARLARRVVVVEDNDDARATLAELLRLHGHEVREAADGPAGVAAILECAPDVALVDIGLPGLDGRALAREVRRRATWPLRLVALSGYGAHDDEGDDFDDYLVKPLDPAKLDEVLAAAPTGAE